MKSKIFWLLGMLLIFGLLATGCPDNSDVWTEEPEVIDPPTLSSLSIAGDTVTSTKRGKPNTDAAQVQAGNITLSSSAKENDEPTLTVTGSPSITIKTTTKPSSGVVVRYNKTTTLTPPSTNYSGTVSSLKNGDYLWIRLAKDEINNYYAIKIEVKYVEYTVEEFAIKAQPASRQFSLAEWEEASPAEKALTVEMAEASPGYQYQWYKSTTSSVDDGEEISEATQATYTPDISGVGNYYYYVTVTLVETVTSNVAMIRIAATLDPAPTQFSIGTTRLSYVRGVGGTGSFMFRQGSNADASPDADVNYIDLLMGTLGANILRIMVQDDYLNYINNTVQSRNSSQYPHDARKNFFAVIKRVNEAGGYVFANPWTSPLYLRNLENQTAFPGYFIKTSSSSNDTAASTGNGIQGGYLRRTGMAYVDYATHFQNFLTWLNNNDAPIFALGILNEPDFGGSASYEGMGMSNEVHRNWFRVVGHFTTQKADRSTASNNSRGTLTDSIIPGYGGGGPTHHVMTQSADTMGDVGFYSNTYNDTGANGANNAVEIWGRHYYAGSLARFSAVVGSASHSNNTTNATAWASRPQMSYTGRLEAESLEVSPQMYAPGSTPGSIKREVWQTEHDFNYNSQSVNATNDVSKHWNSAFAAMNDIDWCLRVYNEQVFDWWFSSSYSGFVTSYHSRTGGSTAGAYWGPYEITPRGRAFAHYGRYVNETWLLNMSRDRGSINFNTTYSSFNAGATDPKISAFEDTDGKFISIVMFTPSTSTNNGSIGNGFGAGGTSGNSDPTRGSTNVGRIAVVMPEGFAASSATAIRSYGNNNSTGASYDTGVPVGSPRYWIDEPVFLSTDAGGKSVVEVTLPGGNIISIKVMGEWVTLPGGSRHFEPRVRPYERYQNGEISGDIMVEGMTPPVR